MINILTKNVADKIAAGEVVDRPVSIIKELTENSIDAGASSITVEIRSGGKEYIRVTDNGSGIDFEDTERAFLRHATSKICTADDLRHIETLGFRGEALASIAAVTRTEMLTKTKESKAGTKVIIHGGEIVTRTAVGCPEGTSIVVTDLFYNTPARAKFMKSESAETSLIIDLISRMALTRPEIRFNLINNGKSIFVSPGLGERLKTIISVYKERDFKDLLELHFKRDGISVEGYISRPSLSKNNRRSQFFFVNGRVVKSNTIEKGLSAGYKERLFEGRYPVAFIFVYVDPEKLDVNIHPNKKEVRFDDEVAVSSAVCEAVIHALASSQAMSEPKDSIAKLADKKITTPEADFKVSQKELKKEDESEQINIRNLLQTKRDFESEFIIPNGLSDAVMKDGADDYQKKIDAESLISSEVKPVVTDINASSDSSNICFGKPDLNYSAQVAFDFDNLKLGDIFFGTYISASDDENFYLIDQHAAHERVNYEKFINAYFSSEKNSQVLLLPFTFDVPNILTTDDEEWLNTLNAMGYHIESFGENTYIVKEIPEFVTIPEAEGFVNDFIDSFAEGVKLNNKIVIDKLITKSCKSAIKAHDMISEEEAEELLKMLKQCRNPFSCPHGRPTFVRFSIREIERMFKRIV
ncbi:hypothetical protein HMPREF0380_01102 [Eubacterium infirmum F0142]|nr:hypothetical protein HMPREF0380_01102 [Eubacterium infirmum F0142]